MSISFRIVILSFLVLLALPAAAAEERAGILVIGDSLSAAYNLPREAGWVSLLEQRLAEQGYDQGVVNSSISGDTTRGGSARLPAALERHQPDIVIIELGGNDGLRGIPIEVTRRNLQRMIDSARGSGAHVLLLGIQIPPNYGPDYTRAFREMYGELAEQPGVGLVPFLLEGVALEEGMMLSDGIHPSEQGQVRMLENVWPHLASMICGGAANSISESG